MSIVSVGVDLCRRDRIERVLARFGDRFVRRILDDSERREGADAAYLCRQFAGKEAVAKALGTGLGAGVAFSQIRVLRKRGGAPYIELAGQARRRAETLGITRFHISLSDEQTHALAFVVAEQD